MTTFRKQVYGLVASLGVLISALLFYAASIAPRADTAVPVLIMLVFIYAISANILSLLFCAIKGERWLMHITTVFMIACIPPAIIMFAALREASFIDLFILFVTVIVIAWYVSYRK
mgnify:CR=1 FL=1